MTCEDQKIIIEEEYNRIVSNMNKRIEELEAKNEALMKTLVRKEEEILELKNRVKKINSED
ncbi:hypothetical protein KY334_03690 [Candidatus Woesearchaeota archaeon]|nr:hypothetical protein [Candidatus Woesearchaeota archaeon]